MFWVKRLMPFLLLLVIAFGYLMYDRISAEREYQQAQWYALATAKIWVATARFRHEPERFLEYRDSVLEAQALSRESIQDYLDRYKDYPEEYDLFTKLVNQYVDSLSAFEMELSQEDTTVNGNSIEITK